MITCSSTSFCSASREMSGSCCVEITTVSMRFGLPRSYSTVTCDFPSGRRYGSAPLFRTAASCRHNRCASAIVSGMYSGVSLHANPTIIPWSPAPVSRSSFSPAPSFASSDLFTPIAMSLDCSLIETMTPHVSQSKP